MAQVDPGFVELALSLVLVLVAVVLSAWRGLKLERSMMWASARAIVQLVAVGAVLGVILAPTAPLVWSWLWIAGMSLFGADIVRRRVGETKGVFLLALLSFAASGAVALGALFGLQIFPLRPNALVPLAGMMIGNSMNSTVLAARRVVEEIRDKADEVEARLALGHSSREAAHPYLASALRTALIPQIETTKAVGLVFLPGAMTGLILAGVDPFDAVIVQAIVMFLVLGSAAITATVISYGIVSRLFTSDHRLRPLPRPAELKT